MIRALLWPLRLLLRLSKVALAILFVASVLVSLAVTALNVAMLTSSTVFNAASGIVEAVTSGKSVRSGQRREVEAQRNRASAAEQRTRQARSDAASQRRNLNAEKARSRSLNDQLRTTNSQRDDFRRQVEANRVNYKGQRVNPREAVKDATARVSRRLTRATVTNVGSMFGEALPIAGIAVIASATAYEVYEACAMLDELQELASAFDPEGDPLDRHVCGISVPTADVIMEHVTSSPAAAWEQVKDYYGELPDLESFLVLPQQAYDWFWTWSDSEP